MTLTHSYIKTLSLIALLSLVSCATNLDPRVKELISLRTVRVSADAAFSVYYQQRSEELRAILSVQQKEYDTYLSRMHDLNKKQNRVVDLIKHIDRLMLMVYNQIVGKDNDQTLILYLHELVQQLVRIVTDIGLQIHE